MLNMGMHGIGSPEITMRLATCDEVSSVLGSKFVWTQKPLQVRIGA